MFNRDEIEFTVEIMPEDLPIEGNCMASGDDEFDRECEQNIQRDLESGNPWAWCIVRVGASHPKLPGIEGTDYLGCCSYASEDDFKAGGYFDDMCESAYQDLCDTASLLMRSMQSLAEQDEPDDE